MHKIAPTFKLSYSKALKHSKFRHTDTRKASGLFLWYHTGVDFSFCNNFAKFGFFAKVSVPV